MSTTVPATEGGSPILGREPVIWLALIGTAIQLFSALVLPLSDGVQGALNAAAVAVLGFVGAAMVSAEKAVPAAVGLFQAALALGVAFGLDLAPETQSTVMAFVGVLATFITRQLVVSPVAPTTSLVLGQTVTQIQADPLAARDEHGITHGDAHP